MNRNRACALLLAALAVTPACKKEEAKPAAVEAPVTEDEKTVYALGAMMGDKFARPMNLSEREVDMLVKGLRATCRGGKPDFPIEAYASKFDGFARARAAANNAAVAASTKQGSEAFRAAAAKEAGAQSHPSGLIYRTLKAGSGASPQATDVVKVHYHGTLPDGKVFDSSIQRGEPVEFPLNQVIPCWTEAVQRMKVGEKARLVCPSQIAYGDGGTPDGTIPPGATLVFEVELLGIKGR
jgi:FKBP-type peptidyl-prolyl cis-trans isomerase FkpA